MHQKKLEGGALKTKAAKYSTEVQQKEHKRKALEPTLRNKGQGVATTEEKQKAQDFDKAFDTREKRPSPP